jgi:branched-chain amino acid transport system permease protein
MAIAAPLVIRDNYERELLVMTLIFAMLALSLDLIIGYMGQFSFGHQAFFGIGAYTSTLLTLKLGVPVWIGFLGAITAGAVSGFVLAFISLRGSRGMALAVITLGFGVIIWLVGSHSYRLTGGMAGLYNIPSPTISIPYLFQITFRSELSYYYLALGMLLFTLYLISSLLRSRFGRALIGLRENEDLASSVGISPFRYYLWTFTFATALAGLAGATWVHHLRVINPTMLSLHYMQMMLIMVLVGGTGTLGGPVLGAFVFTFILEHLQFSLQLKYLLFGIILVVSILFMPRGLYPRITSLWKYFVIPKVSDWSKRNRRKRAVRWG